MRKEIPAGVLEMLSVPGLRPDKLIGVHSASVSLPKTPSI
jgi:hypothetical protein